MNALYEKIKGNWNMMKGSLKKEFAELVDDDLLYEEGKEDELIGRIQKRVGQSKEYIEKYMETISDEVK